MTGTQPTAKRRSAQINRPGSAHCQSTGKRLACRRVRAPRQRGICLIGGLATQARPHEWLTNVWVVRQVPAAEDCPGSVFIEDAVVVCEDLAVLARSGAPIRRAEVAGVAGILRSLGLRTAQIREPGTLDGGDVLQAGDTVYVGRGGRTNGAGIRQLRALLAPLGRTVIAVPLGNVLHLKSAVTVLSDGTFLLLPQLVPAGLFPAVRAVD